MTKARRRLRIPRAQWTLPAGVHTSTGRAATLRDVVDPKVATRAFHTLPYRQQAEIVAARIRGQERFRLWTFGLGQISKRRAVEALKERTPLGQALLDLELSILVSLEAEASRRRRRRGVRGPR